MLLKYHFPVKETRKFCGKGGSAVGMCENGIPTHTDKKKLSSSNYQKDSGANSKWHPLH